ncbi:ABC transporter ATP-binding protein [Paenibacillus lemnae]|nr:ABC transporter ATP-binding protein [Paenibacillus lemnae]
MSTQGGMEAAALYVDKITVEIAGRTIVEEISLSAERNVVGLIGPNGSGKSTVLRAIYRMLRPASGRVLAADRDVWKSRPREAARVTAAVVQDGPSDLELTVAECVATGRIAHGPLFGSSVQPEDTLAIERAMMRAGVNDLANRDMSSLSGGERQRVQLARALAQEPRILVLDEPTNHLDIRHQLELMTLVRTLGVTTLVTLHDLNLAAAYCDRLVILSKGQVVASGTPGETLTPDLLLKVFGIRAQSITNPLTGRMQLAYGHETELKS